MNAKDYEKLGAVGEAVDICTDVKDFWVWNGRYWMGQESAQNSYSDRLINFRLLREGWTPPLEEPTEFPALVEDEDGFLYASNGEKVGSGTIKWHLIDQRNWIDFSDLTVTKIYKVGE